MRGDGRPHLDVLDQHGGTRDDRFARIVDGPGNRAAGVLGRRRWSPQQERQ